MRHAMLSIVCTLLSVPTLGLMVTVFLFPAVGFLIGIKAYRQCRRERSNRLGRHWMLAAFPMIFAVLVFVLEISFINSTYRA